LAIPPSKPTDTALQAMTRRMAFSLTQTAANLAVIFAPTSIPTAGIAAMNTNGERIISPH